MPLAKKDLKTLAKLSPLIAELATRLGMERDLRETVGVAELKKVLEKRKYPLYDHVLDFEARYGGLLIPHPGYPDWRGENEFAVLGTWGSLQHGTLGNDGSGLVP